MNTVLSFLSNLKLTITQWALMLLTLVVAALVVALRLQGTRLHATQVNLLKAQFGNAMSLQDAKVDAARTAFENAIQEYEDAKNSSDSASN
jgi:hypothetical protein